ncbi:hypothetical protein OYT1_ch1642 [Ferriphaselus amnicola]|uniref:Uncharacterized protein n=1 Tax=Ferriphaselus amnicola TaxID=1188319 RepID=A0A2Z6GCF3_9PROT|nr:hypothetical protein [Ferriphaselus amnicola]BBE51188.1 hypothetical protein OYT1_ch1642 [Ferriphaselus amnicola]
MLIKITLSGVSPLICNRFTEAAQQKVSAGTTVAIRGAQGMPREQAEPKLYLDANSKPCIPSPNLMRAIVDAGTFIKSGKSKLSTQRTSLVPAGISIVEPELPITPSKWEVDSRSVVIPATGGRVMAHRPRFDEWRLSLTLDVDTDMFDEGVARQLVDLAGQRIGLGDFRPARRGPFGRFRVDSWKKI